MASHLCHKLLILNMFSFLALGALLSFLNPNAADTSPVLQADTRLAELAFYI